MARRRNYYRYELKQDHKLVYVGITNNPTRREIEHSKEGKRFTKMAVVGPVVTKKTAEKWEEERLSKYSKNHGGNTPSYNKTNK